MRQIKAKSTLTLIGLFHKVDLPSPSLTVNERNSERKRSSKVSVVSFSRKCKSEALEEEVEEVQIFATDGETRGNSY